MPDHDEKTPSFYIYPLGRWWCYGCDRGGDVVDLEFHCGDYGELWEAMIALAVEYDVELPQRPPSWFRHQERQKPVRDAIVEARVEVMMRRLWRWIFEPILADLDAADERVRVGDELWATVRLLVVRLVEDRKDLT